MGHILDRHAGMKTLDKDREMKTSTHVMVNAYPAEVAEGYELLFDVLQEALNQAQFGKGRERHAEGGKGFHEQDICQEARDLGFAYPVGQARKKAKEALRLDPDRAIEDLLGAINYLAAVVIVIKERKSNQTERQ
jgi:hypothetical protein